MSSLFHQVGESIGVFLFHRNGVNVENMSNKMKELRLKRGWTQKDLAEKLNTVHQNVQRWETEKRKIPQKILSKLRSIFGCSAEEILGYTEYGLRDNTTEYIQPTVTNMPKEELAYDPDLADIITHIANKVLRKKRVNEADAFNFITELYDFAKETGKDVDEKVAEWYFKKRFDPEKYK